MTDDRAEFAANRDAGLVKRHEQRLAPEPVRALAYLMAQYDLLLELHEQVVMDTPEDQELKSRAVATFREAAEPVRKALAVWKDPRD